MAANQIVNGLGYTSLQYQQGGLGNSSLQSASGGGGPVFPLDGLTAPAAAYATMALNTGYVLDLAEFRADAGPNNTVQVFPNANGKISTASAVIQIGGGGVFLGATLGEWIVASGVNGGCASGDAFVVQLTDQFGTNHWRQNTVGSQPYAVEAGILCINSAAAQFAVRNPIASPARLLVTTTNPAYVSGAWTMVAVQAALETANATVGAQGIGSNSINWILGLRRGSSGQVRGQSIFNTTGNADGQYDYTPASTPKVYSWNSRPGTALQVNHENVNTDWSAAGNCTRGIWPGQVRSVSSGANPALPCDTLCMIIYAAQQPLADMETLRTRLVTAYGAA